MLWNKAYQGSVQIEDLGRLPLPSENRVGRLLSGFKVHTETAGVTCPAVVVGNRWRNKLRPRKATNGIYCGLLRLARFFKVNSSEANRKRHFVYVTGPEGLDADKNSALYLIYNHSGFCINLISLAIRVRDEHVARNSRVNPFYVYFGTAKSIIPYNWPGLSLER